MIPVLKLNIKESERVFKLISEELAPHECYNNSFKVALHYKHTEHKNFKIAYGYLNVTSINIWVRHCVVLLDDLSVVDPIHLNYKAGRFGSTTSIEPVNTDNIIYEFAPFRVMTLEEFMEEAEARDYKSDLRFTEGELLFYKNFFKEALEHTIIESDFYYYITPMIFQYNQ